MLEDRHTDEEQPFANKSTVDENDKEDVDMEKDGPREETVAGVGGGGVKTKIPKKKKLFKQRISLNPVVANNNASPSKSGDMKGDHTAGTNSGGEKDGQQQQQLELQQQKNDKDTAMDVDKTDIVDDATEKETEEAAAATAAAESKQGAAAAASSALENNNQESQTTSPNKPPPKKKIKPSATKEDLEATAWTSCYSVAFNKNGSYLASGHASGLVPVHSFASRCLNAVYTPLTSVNVRFQTEHTRKNNDNDENNYEHKPSIIKQEREIKHVNGTTLLSWDNTGQYLVAGAYDDTMVRLMDNSHPAVAWECAELTRNTTNFERKGSKTNSHAGEGEMSLDQKILQDCDSESPAIFYWRNGSTGEDIPLYFKAASLGKGRLLKNREKEFSIRLRQSPSQLESPSIKCKPPNTTIPCVRHSTILFELPQPLGGPCQFHDSYDGIGMARLMDSSLILFHIPPAAFYEMLPGHASEHAHTNSRSVDMELHNLLEKEEANMAGNILYIVPPTPTSETSEASTSTPNYSVLCAAFGKGKYDNMLFALTKCGLLLAFEMNPSMISSLQGKESDYQSGDIKPSLVVKIPGCTTATRLVVNERFMLVNTSDALRLYNLDASRNEEVELTPDYVFQDPVSKAPWIACDFSSDGEYVVGGCNSFPQPGDNYQLFLWNVVTGELLDQLNGPQVSLYCLNCHPTRPFIAVGSSDGIIDIWGYRKDWIAFAPDFQALQQNVLYEEKEDEFDIVVDADGNEIGDDSGDQLESHEDEEVDITTKMHVPFSSDNTKDDFYFHTRVLKLMQ